MPTYILKAPPTHTLNYGGKAYRDGDRITLPKADAERISNGSRFYRFEDAAAQLAPAPVQKPATP